MLPILINFGPIKIYSYGVMLFLGLFLGLYFWWKMGRDEHFEEIELFDGYFLSMLIFFAMGRIAYVTMIPELHTWYRGFAFLAYPGLNVMAGIVGVIIYIILYARAHEWESWRVLDITAVTLAAILIFGSVGAVLNGSNPGLPSSWGLIYPGETIKRIPVDAWSLIWSLATFGIVSRVRKQFRFFTWYKGEASVAREGLAFLMFTLLTGVYLVIQGLIDEVGTRIWIIPGMTIFGLGIVLCSALWIYTRSGRNRGFDLVQWVSQIRRRR